MREQAKVILVQLETPGEAYDRVYAEVMKFYKAKWNYRISKTWQEIAKIDAKAQANRASANASKVIYLASKQYNIDKAFDQEINGGFYN